jgi:hypothetical protein
VTATLWIDTPSETTAELGGTQQMYSAFGEMARAGGENTPAAYPELFGVPFQVETQADADPQWLDAVRRQAAAFLAAHGPRLGPDARGVLATLADAPQPPP